MVILCFTEALGSEPDGAPRVHSVAYTSRFDCRWYTIATDFCESVEQPCHEYWRKNPCSLLYDEFGKFKAYPQVLEEKFSKFCQNFEGSCSNEKVAGGSCSYKKNDLAGFGADFSYGSGRKIGNGLCVGDMEAGENSAGFIVKPPIGGGVKDTHVGK
ncbi:hypothetical protein GOP47_0029062 [Adiantum capillus-veneris]|nr:hypothetical protein GOP47_0029062 [Adiantum capillus-veneris]